MPRGTVTMDQISHIAYTQMHDELAARLEAVRLERGLDSALRALETHQIGSGFIRDNLAEVQRYRFPRGDGSDDYFSAQYNPARARRFGGAGLRVPPQGETSRHAGCFLCRDNIWWQQQGAEIGYDLPLAGERYTAWMNPFPLAPGHTVIATREHIPQGWSGNGEALLELIADLIELAAALPGWIGFYNGVGAGASIPGHRHVHFLPRPADYGLMPLEVTMARDHRDGLFARRYPMQLMHWHGKPRSVTDAAQSWIADWLDRAGHCEQATANFIVTASSDGERIDGYFIPRHQAYSRAEGLDGVIGGFEALGEIVCSTPEEKARLDSGELDYQRIAGILGQVSVAL